MRRKVSENEVKSVPEQRIIQIVVTLFLIYLFIFSAFFDDSFFHRGEMD